MRVCMCTSIVETGGCSCVSAYMYELVKVEMCVYSLVRVCRNNCALINKYLN